MGSLDRLVMLDRELTCLRLLKKPMQWKDVFIIYHSDLTSSTSHRASSLSHTFKLLNRGSPPFRFHRHTIDVPHHELSLSSQDTVLSSVWTGACPVHLTFGSQAILYLGLCPRSTDNGRAEHFARLKLAPEPGQTLTSHDCALDHIAAWPGRSRKFKNYIFGIYHEVTLSFTPCLLEPQHTLVVHLAGFRELGVSSKQVSAQELALALADGPQALREIVAGIFKEVFGTSLAEYTSRREVFGHNVSVLDILYFSLGLTWSRQLSDSKYLVFVSALQTETDGEAYAWYVNASSESG